MTEGANTNSAQASGGKPHSQDPASGANTDKTQRPAMTQPQATVKRKSLYDRLTYDMQNDHKVNQEVRMGKRVGYYKLKGQLGTGNFAKVKLGVHLLTTGKKRINKPPYLMFINQIVQYFISYSTVDSYLRTYAIYTYMYVSKKG